MMVPSFQHSSCAKVQHVETGKIAFGPDGNFTQKMARLVGTYPIVASCNRKNTCIIYIYVFNYIYILLHGIIWYDFVLL